MGRTTPQKRSSISLVKSSSVPNVRVTGTTQRQPSVILSSVAINVIVKPVDIKRPRAWPLTLRPKQPKNKLHYARYSKKYGQIKTMCKIPVPKRFKPNHTTWYVYPITSRPLPRNARLDAKVDCLKCIKWYKIIVKREDRKPNGRRKRKDWPTNIAKKAANKYKKKRKLERAALALRLLNS